MGVCSLLFLFLSPCVITSPLILEKRIIQVCCTQRQLHSSVPCPLAFFPLVKHNSEDPTHPPRGAEGGDLIWGRTALPRSPWQESRGNPGLGSGPWDSLGSEVPRPDFLGFLKGETLSRRDSRKCSGRRCVFDVEIAVKPEGQRDGLAESGKMPFGRGGTGMGGLKYSDYFSFSIALI